MIKRFWGKNFGVLTEFSIDLEPLTLLVGPNASGKSSFLRALRLLAMLTRQRLYWAKSVMPLGYRATVGDYIPPHDLKRQITLGVAVESQQGSGEYEIRLGYHVDNRLKILGEKIKWTRHQGSSLEYDSSEGPFRLNLGGETLSIEVPREFTIPNRCFRYRANPNCSAQLAPLWELTAAFAPFYAFRFMPSQISRPVPLQTPVSHDGTGIVAALDELASTRRDEFDQLVSKLKDTFDHIKEIKIPPIPGPEGEGGLKALFIVRRDGTEVPGELESDGVLLTLAYLWLSTQNMPAFGVEEPEMATYPSLLGDRFRLLRSIAQGGGGRRPVQVIATTHSSMLLTNAQETRIVRVFKPQGDGSTRIYKPSQEFMQQLVYEDLGWAVNP